ncbi:MAG: DNA cytosine methyltransferase, partial [Opitutae bacterium]|nr:DNA cytosine methyltransferase [Opitutae bacterium]
MSRFLTTNSVPVSGSLFSGGGVGDVGIEWGCGIPVLSAIEMMSSRAQLIIKNFPQTKVFEGDIWKLKEEYISFFKKKLDGKRPWLLTLSPPCQGMSANGAGRIASSIRSGIRPHEDERNRLILPGISVLEK